MVKIGVLGLQGAVREHVRSIEESGAEAVIIKRKEQLADVDGLILPGGESTTMRRLIDKYGFMDELKEFARQGKPMFGTCAGLILLAKKLLVTMSPIWELWMLSLSAILSAASARVLKLNLI